VYTDTQPIVVKFDEALPADQLTALMGFRTNSRYTYTVDGQGNVLLRLGNGYTPVHAEYANFFNPTEPIFVIPGNLTDLAGNVYSPSISYQTSFFSSALQVNPATQNIFNLGLDSRSVITTLELDGSVPGNGLIGGTAGQWASLANKTVVSHIPSLVPVVTDLASGPGALPVFRGAEGDFGYGFDLTNSDVAFLFANRTWDVWAEQLQYARFVHVGGVDGRMVFGQDGMDDTLNGSNGQQVLVGGYDGTDTFVFNHASVVQNPSFVADVIADFGQERFSLGSVQDKIVFDFAGLAQNTLRGNGTVYQEIGLNDVLDVNAGLVVLKDHAADLSVANARGALERVKGKSNGDKLFLVFDNGVDSALYFMAETDNNLGNGFETVQKIATLYGVNNAANALSDLNFPNFHQVL
jgi:hypothetical protein